MSAQTGLTSGVLPVHPKLLPDELLTSWIVRLAHANHMKVHTLATMLAGANWAPFWNRDLDRSASQGLLLKLAELTATSLERIQEATVTEAASRLVGWHQPKGSTPWVLPLGVWHRKRRAFGTQFCPLCLHMDAQPYYRRAWRLAFYTECEMHHVLMEDRCPACKQPICFFRSDLGDREEVEGLPAYRCTACRFNLGHTLPRRFEWPHWELTVATRSLMFFNFLPWAFLGGMTFESAPQLFSVLRQLVSVMSSSESRGELYDYVACQLWPSGYPVLSHRSQAYEFRDVQERHRLFGMGVWLLQEWPARLELATDRLALSNSQLMRDSPSLPDWFLERHRQHARTPGKGGLRSVRLSAERQRKT